MRAKTVKRTKWRAKTGAEHEEILLVFCDTGAGLASFETPEEAEVIGRELLRLAAHWREERARAKEGASAA
jgi:hypothetical protein